jgi:hypothetical protein
MRSKFGLMFLDQSATPLLMNSAFCMEMPAFLARCIEYS